jgi:L-fucose isomerase-like protein
MKSDHTMTKQKLTATQYDELKQFLVYFSDRFFGLKSENTENKLLVALNDMEKAAPSRAASSLQMMINDCIEMSSGWPGARVSGVDADLLSNGIITLTELRRRYSRDYATIIKRGRINNEEEYYLLKGVLDGVAFNMTPFELEHLTNILNAYEREVINRGDSQ